jgi:hypothetical protein
MLHAELRRFNVAEIVSSHIPENALGKQFPDPEFT